MKINQLEVSNFKLFAEKTFTFHPSFNLIVGVNGSGKTSLLKAISVALGGWAHAYLKNDSNLRPILDSEIRELQIDKRFDKTKATLITAHGIADVVDRYGSSKPDRQVMWSRAKIEGANLTFIASSRINYGSGRDYLINFENLGSDILKYLEDRGTFNLPLIAVYECDRLWLPKTALDQTTVAKQKIAKFDGYVDCFHTGANHQSIGEWLLKHELASLQQKTDTPYLKSIHAAAKAAIDDCKDFRFDFEEGRVLLDFKDGTTKAFEHLSDGQRTMLGLFCDIARRAAILNPHLGEEASAKTKGVVLIDELDLHLHPKWQRRIIGDLKRIFPKIQFICTTHSPQLIGQAKPEEIILLDEAGEQTMHPHQSLGMDSNWVLRHIMGSEDRDPAIAQKMDSLFDAIEHGDFEAAKSQLQQLRSEIGEHPELTEADALILRYTQFADIEKA
jgi:predicted ATP-binding protein involved in virulence